jgi:hypothetical protein
VCATRPKDHRKCVGVVLLNARNEAFVACRADGALLDKGDDGLAGKSPWQLPQAREWHGGAAARSCASACPESGVLWLTLTLRLRPLCTPLHPPQGGVDKGEEPLAAAFRELYEETGVRSAELIGEVRTRNTRSCAMCSLLREHSLAHHCALCALV